MSASAQQKIEKTRPHDPHDGAPPLPSPAHNLRSHVIDLLQMQPGLVVTFGYLLLTAVGITYDVLYYGIFRIPILNFSEPSDFILAGFRQPILFLFVVLSVLMLRRLIFKDRKWREKSPRYRELAENMERSRWYSNWVMYPFFICVYFWSITAIYARYTASQVIAGEGRVVRVELSGDSADERRREPTELLIGTNSKFVFLYEPTPHGNRSDLKLRSLYAPTHANGNVRIVPIGNIVRMTLDPAISDASVPPSTGRPPAEPHSAAVQPQRGGADR
jgi:hypothetical protein